ncbi:MAG TPA: chromosome segregation protein SMC, partial [Steroidobacteraceae bacterium]|nr:chromosome segregation protein SMC [Steroidobacteraceae bacterium]
RENLERLQDVRDEVEKQIRHLQRQAASARRYQALKEQERRLTAELLALRLRELDSGAEVHDATVRARELAMQAEISAQRAAEAAIERQRSVHTAHGETLASVQARYYEVGADISRLEQAIEHTRELRERQRADLTQTEGTLAELASHIARDEAQLAALGAELGELAPQLAAAEQAERHATQALAAAERAQQDWQQRWETHTQEVSGAEQTSEVERARIEQLENQLRRLAAQQQRLAAEEQALGAQHAEGELEQLTRTEAAAHARREELAHALATSQERLQQMRVAQLAAEGELERARAAREGAREELTSLEALQAAALSDHAGDTTEWLSGAGLAARPRLAAALEVEPGWERAVETVLGDYLEAVCVEALDEAADSLGALKSGRLTLIEGEGGAPAAPGTLGERVQGPAAIVARLAGVLTAADLSEALGARAQLADGVSYITPAGEWVGRRWLRVSRGAEARAGVLERAQRLKGLRAASAGAAAAASEAEGTLAGAREALRAAEAARDERQQALQAGHRTHAEALAALEARRDRATESQQRGARLREDAGELAHEHTATQEALALSRAALESASGALARLEARHAGLGSEREERRDALSGARSQAQATQMSARELHVRVESRRSTQSSVEVGMGRMSEQRTQLEERRRELAQELASGDEPVIQAQGRLGAALELRLAVEAELGAARTALEEADLGLRALDEERLAAEQRVALAREATDAARLAAQETHVRRAALAEQFAETRRELSEVLAALAPEAQVPVWEQSLSETRADVERLGQVNLAAIDELKDHTQRKEYLDSQFTDLTSALDTLEEAMRRIDKETRTRFDDTFERINAGLREKFPRLFGGGHAYLELVGEDKLSAGVAVMARPPGKKNSTIHLLSGGEKALTAVALVFSIFDLNPAPFCLLDEVDAPLDEHNVGRFCDIVREMSSRVQFVFITHNKSTMELAAQLIGVTMNEPGVSRLVTVDVDEAVRLAAV